MSLSILLGVRHSQFGAVSRLRGALSGSEEVNYMTINY